MSEPELVLYYAPRSRSFTALWLLEELGRPYRLEAFDLAGGRHKQPEFLALNGMGKVPVVVDRGVAVSELGAIAIHLADRFPEAGLGPAPNTAERPAFLRWCFFSSAIMEPCLGERFFKWELPASSVAWGSYAQMMQVLTAAVDTEGPSEGRAEGRVGPWLLGERFSTADVLVGSTLRFGVTFGAIPSEGPPAAYLERLTARPAFARALAIETEQGERFPRP